jgi:hypothetical protein
MGPVFLFGLLNLACAGPSDSSSSTEVASSASSVVESTPSQACIAAYDGLIATGALVFTVEGKVWGDADRLEVLATDEDRSGASLRQRNRLHTSQGVREGFDLFDCSTGQLRYVGFKMDKERRWYDYQPGQIWPETPLIEETTWSDTVTTTFVSLDDDTVEELWRSRRDYRVLGPETLQTPEGPLETFSMSLEITDEGQELPRIIITDWFLVDAPMVLVQREQRTEASPGEYISGALRLLTMENSPE